MKYESLLSLLHSKQYSKSLQRIRKEERKLSEKHT
jgi:hypothetical protein